MYVQSVHIRLSCERLKLAESSSKICKFGRSYDNAWVGQSHCNDPSPPVIMGKIHISGILIMHPCLIFQYCNSQLWMDFKRHYLAHSKLFLYYRRCIGGVIRPARQFSVLRGIRGPINGIFYLAPMGIKPRTF